MLRVNEIEMNAKIDQMKCRFYELIGKINLTSNNELLSVQKVKDVKQNGKKTPADFRLLKHYDVLDQGEVENRIFTISTVNEVRNTMIYLIYFSNHT